VGCGVGIVASSITVGRGVNMVASSPQAKTMPLATKGKEKAIEQSCLYIKHIFMAV